MIRILPAGIDLVLVLIFSILGRASHSEALTPAGVAATAWPFLVACLFAWVVVSLLDDDGYGARAALVVWLVTVLGGLGLRILGGDTAAWPFVLVATGSLALLFSSWRMLRHLLQRGGPAA